MKGSSMQPSSHPHLDCKLLKKCSSNNIVIDSCSNQNNPVQGGVGISDYSFKKNSQRIHVNPAKYFNRDFGSLNIEALPNTSLKTDKIYCNPNFLHKSSSTDHIIGSQSLNVSSANRNIHINPLFNHAHQDQNNFKPEKVFVNPSFLSKKQSSLSCNVLSKAVTSNNVQPVSQGVSLTNQNDVKLNESVKYSQKGGQLPKPLKQNDNIKPVNKVSNSLQYPSLSCSKIPLTLIHNKYKKVNVCPSKPYISSSINFKQNRFSLQRSNFKPRVSQSMISTQKKPHMPVDPLKEVKFVANDSFRKIGKRKLIHKSLVQKYISSRCQTTPFSIHKMRQIVKSKKNKILFKRLKYQMYSKNRQCYKKINKKEKQPLKPNSEFIKFGRRKIIRKSILSSISEARKTALRFNKTKSISRFKIRNSKLSRSQINKRILNKKMLVSKQINPLDQTALLRLSKSFMYRLRPGVRLGVRLHEKRLALLRKNNMKCLFYNRFGFCKGKDKGTCKRIHDHKSVAVCKKFVLGECNDEACKLNHTKSKEKMPTCHQFLAGVCVREQCPFLHVKLNVKTSVCREFLSGYCPKGNLCEKRHVFVCPEWESGSCRKKPCPFPHVSKTKANKKSHLKIPKNMAKITETSLLSKEGESESKERYFGEESEFPSSEIIEENIEDLNETEDDTKMSVYENENLLSFIPFKNLGQ